MLRVELKYGGKDGFSIDTEPSSARGGNDGKILRNKKERINFEHVVWQGVLLWMLN